MELQESQPTVLIVDDTPENITILVSALRDSYLTKVATSGMQALEVCRSIPVDVILLDVMMPEMDGYETCRRIKADSLTADIPVIFVTALRESKDEAEGFASGAVDFISKPIHEPIVHARVKTHVELHRARRELLEWNANLKRKAIHNAGMIREKYQMVSELQRDSEQVPLLLLSRVLQTLDDGLFSHARNVRELAVEAARQLSLDKGVIREISLAALLHDIGKQSMKKKIGSAHAFDLSKVMLHAFHQHPVSGQELCNGIEAWQGAGLMIRHHHELLDGSGFPDGLKGDAIPLGAQLIGIADFIDHAAREVVEVRVDHAFTRLAMHAATGFNPELFQKFRSAAESLYATN